MQWESYAPRYADGVELGLKARSFDAIADLPMRVGVPLEIALGGATAPRARLMKLGWQLRDPMPVSASLGSYQRYLQSSRGEFSVAKHGYVTSRCGWFSERSANYLASGRPVVVEETGFSKWLDTGRGVIPYSNLQEAVLALDEVVNHYELHAIAAREIASDYFDSRRVLGDLLGGCT